MANVATSPSFPDGLPSLRSEHEARQQTQEARLDHLRATMEAAGESPAVIEEVISSTRIAFAYGDAVGSIYKMIGL